MDGGTLVGGFFKPKVVGKHLVVLRRVAKRVALASSTPCINIEQLRSCIADLLGGTAFGFVPLTRTQAVQRGFIGADAAVAADQMQLTDRHIQGGFVRVFQMQKLLQQGLT